ncbi:MAG: hypothetical protein NC102_05665 [Clostridium sp.]|nr:hypothetical protein [Clostridium sp.]
MKKTFAFSLILAVAALAGCSNQKEKEELAQARALNESTKEELVQAVQERDQLLDLINEIASTTDEIKNVENIVSINASQGETEANNTVASDIAVIKATLQERRKKIEDLEETLRKSKTSNSKLLGTIETLKQQVADQTAQIETLTASLSEAQQKIASLDVQVDSLSTHIASVTEQRDSVEAVAAEQTLLANQCFYAIGTNKELKEHDIIEGGGFLRKSKIMQGDFDKSFFVAADKRTLSVIPLHAKKAKVITSYQPKESYQILDNNGQAELHITDPAQFWSVSNYLVIQVD